MLAVFDSETLTCIYSNERYAALGNRSAAALLGMSLSDVVGPPHADEVVKKARKAVETNAAITYSRASAAPDASARHIEVSFIPDRRPEARRLYVLVSDITKHRAAETALEQSITRLHKFMAASEEGIAFHIDGVITDVNQALLRMLGYSNDEMVGKRTLEFVPPAEHQRVTEVIASRAEIAYESRAIHKVRGEIPVEYIVRDMLWAGVLQRMVIVRDLSERKATLQRIRFLALHDSLSGLPNRASLDEHLAEMTNVKAGLPFATLFLDVDQLKRINDSLGHAAGDELLIQVGDRLSQACRKQLETAPGAWLSRIGGDEFVITYACGKGDALDDFVSGLETAFDAPFKLSGRSIKASASIGIAVYPDDGVNPSQLLKNADTAMYAAKASGRRAVRYFDEALARTADATLETEQDLATAIEQNQFELYFQPVVSADGGQLLSAEALVRWNHPTRGLLLPNEFIQIAEESNLFLPIGQWVLEAALAHVKRWIVEGWADARVSINLSSNELRAEDFVEVIVSTLKSADLNGRHLELELTERMLMSEDHSLRETLAKLQSAGIGIAIDDFGTGYSSLSRLGTLPINTLKIDQSFIAELPQSHSALAIVTALLQLGRGLAIDVIAEGVEEEAQRDCLDLLGCTAMQGYLFSRPITGDEFIHWIHEHSDAVDATLQRVPSHRTRSK